MIFIRKKSYPLSKVYGLLEPGQVVLKPSGAALRLLTVTKQKATAEDLRQTIGTFEVAPGIRARG